MQTLELAVVLQDVHYSANGQVLGFDLDPFTEDQVAAVRRAVLQWEFIWDLGRKVDRNALVGQRAVYGRWGSTRTTKRKVRRRRMEARQHSA